MPAWEVIEVMKFYIKANTRTLILALSSRCFLLFCFPLLIRLHLITPEKYIHLSNESRGRERGVDLLGRIGVSSF